MNRVGTIFLDKSCACVTITDGGGDPCEEVGNGVVVPGEIFQASTVRVGDTFCTTIQGGRQ